MKVPAFRFAALMAVTLFSSLACRWLDASLEVEIRLPPIPAVWHRAFPGLEYLIVHPLPTGERAEYAVPADTERIFAVLPKILHLPILLKPLSPVPGLDLKPAGGVFPPEGGGLDGTRPVVTLSWEDGAVASLLFRLYEGAYPIEVFNSPRLVAECRTRFSDDPWLLDGSEACEAILCGEFTVSSLAALPRRDSVSVYTGFDLWVSENPFETLVAASPDFHVESLTYGLHAYFGLESGRRLFVEVDERGVRSVLADSRSLRDG